jgi:signal transduction histidine kinase
MPTPRPRFSRPAWLRWPRRTARLRFTAVYTGLFLLSGAALITITFALFQHATQYEQPHLPQIPNTPAIQALKIPAKTGPGAPTPLAAGSGPLGQALDNVSSNQNQLAQAQHQLKVFASKPGPGPAQLVLPATQLSQLTQDQQKLTQDQQQLTTAVNKLAQAVHQVAQAGTVQAAQRATDSHQLLVNSGIALGIVAVLALLAGWLMAGRMLRPIRTITRTAQRISSASLHERLALDGPQDELKQLGDTLDNLFGRLDTAFEAQRHFIAHASHELRTPLTAERNLLQVALDDPHTSADTWRDTAHELLASNDEQKHLIEALLALASSESGLDHQEHADLADICQTVLTRPGLDTDRLGLRVEAAIRPAPLDGDPRLIERLVANLVDNATGHNIAGGHIQISTDTTHGKAVLTVTNTGPVIPPGEIDRLFQPFQRLNPRRTHHKNGHGLGLSIVQGIATTHHATITASPLADGGLTVTVTFPPPTSAGTSHNNMPRTRLLATSRP